MSRWICTKGCRVLGQSFDKGDITEHASNPNSSYFAAYSGDVVRQVDKPALTDMDNTYFYPKSGWDDMKFPATTIRQGATTKPDFDTTNVGLLFPQDTATEIAYMVAQMPHSMKAGSDLYPHIHFVQDEEELPVFKLSYRWYSVGGDPTVSFTTITAASFARTYVSGSIHQIATFPVISGAGITGVSSILDLKLFRDDDVVSGDVLVKEFDFHYQIDSLGSGREYQK